MDFPIFVDALDLLEVGAVPLTIGIDEQGVVRRMMRRPAELEGFLAESHLAPSRAVPKPQRLDPAVAMRRAEEAPSTAAWQAAACAAFLWGGDERIDEACALFERAAAESEDPAIRFRLGVALRRRFESAARQPGDFQAAVAAWQTALDARPNQYIWRRRIQQYGPRLEKPYPFYDWVATARREIRARGGEPFALRVEPVGTELAEGATIFEVASEETPPDPEGQIARDIDRLARLEATVVPNRIAPGATARVHLTLRVGEGIPAHWNNEIEDLVVWVEALEGGAVSRHRLQWPSPEAPESDEVRELELEIRVPTEAGTLTLSGYSLYAVCREDDGTCLYRRQDFRVPIEVATTDF